MFTFIVHLLPFPLFTSLRLTDLIRIRVFDSVYCAYLNCNFFPLLLRAPHQKKINNEIDVHVQFHASFAHQFIRCLPQCTGRSLTPPYIIIKQAAHADCTWDASTFHFYHLFFILSLFLSMSLIFSIKKYEWMPLSSKYF